MIKPSNKKKIREQKVYILAKDVDSRRKFEIKANKFPAWKRLDSLPK